MSNPSFDTPVQGIFDGATHNATALAVTTANAGETIVVIASCEVNLSTGGSAVSVSSITNPGTDPGGADLGWTKQKAFPWFSGGGTGWPACIEIWTALAPTAGTYHVTVTFNQTADNACLVACGVIGATGVDAGSVTTNSGSGTNPESAAITSTGGNLLLLTADSGGYGAVTFGVAPSNICTTILEQASEPNGSYYNDLGTYWGTSTGQITAQTVVTNDTHTGGWGAKVWGVVTLAFTSTPTGETFALAATWPDFTSALAATAAAGETFALAATWPDFTSAVAAAIAAAPGNTTFTSWWSVGP